MIQMILMIALQITIGLVMQAASYALMAFIVAYVGRKGWEAGRKGR